MQTRFAGKVALVTGAASGIGAATARRLFAEGARVALCDLDEARLSDVAGQIDPSGERVWAARVDVSVLDQVRAFTDAAAERLWRLDVVVNNAGIGAFGRSTELDPAAWLRTFEVDVHSVFYGTRAALPHLLRAGGGAIVNTASISGVRPAAGEAPYAAAKAGVAALTATAALEYGPRIRVNAVAPGMIETALTQPLLEVFPEQR